MYASFNSSNSNPFNNLSSKVGFSSDKRSFNLNSYNNQIINSFLQQQNNNKSQQQQAPFIQGFPLASANLFPTSFFSLDQNMNEPNFNNNNNNNKQPNTATSMPPLLTAPHFHHPHHSAALLLSQLNQQTNPNDLYFNQNRNDKQNGNENVFKETKNSSSSPCLTMLTSPTYLNHHRSQTSRQVNNIKLNKSNVTQQINQKLNQEPDFYFDSGSSTGPISSNSSTNNDSLSSNVSSSESDCESKPTKQASLNSLPFCI